MVRAATIVLLSAAVVGCRATAPDLLIVPYDAGSDATTDAGADVASPDAADAEPLGLGPPCTDDTQCDDGIKCTYDSCNLTYHLCSYIPDDSQCDDGIYCDGRETCVVHHGCEPGPVVSCDDGDPCTIATCVEASQSCVYTPRDIDGDGDPDDHCLPHRDCNDMDPTVSSLHAEVCKNGKDDNCNGLIDEMPCVNVTGDVCATAIAVTPGDPAMLSTLGANRDYSESCSVSTPTAGSDIVVSIVVPPGANQDLQVWATTGGVEVAVAIESTCGDDATELGCGSGPGQSSIRALARNVAPGTYYAIITTQSETSVEVTASLAPPTTPPTNTDCTAPLPLSPGVTVPVSIVNPPKTLPSACTSETGTLTYSFTLTAPSDVHVFAATVMGSGQPVLGLRDAQCTGATDEIVCQQSSLLPLFARALAAGTYVVTVAATATIESRFSRSRSRRRPSRRPTRPARHHRRRRSTPP